MLITQPPLPDAALLTVPEHWMNDKLGALATLRALAQIRGTRKLVFIGFSDPKLLAFVTKILTKDAYTVTILEKRTLTANERGSARGHIVFVRHAKDPVVSLARELIGDPEAEVEMIPQRVRVMDRDDAIAAKYRPPAPKTRTLRERRLMPVSS